VADRVSKRTRGESPEPRSWDFDTWPETVWPNDPERARWVVRSNRRDLIAEGAITRIGKRVVILGRGYSNWLSRGADRVNQFDSNLPHLRRRASEGESEDLGARQS